MPTNSKTGTTLAFVTSAFNEVENLPELYQRCRDVHEKLREEFCDSLDLQFRMLIADNGSEDHTVKLLEALVAKDPSVEVLVHRINYGVEASVGNLIEQARAYDLVVLMCSDLQDPPEIAGSMIRTLLQHSELDAVMAVKQRSAGGPMLRLARRSYYRALGLTSRRVLVPNGFHGFGCYRQAVLEEAMNFWNATDLSARQCLANACLSPKLIAYIQQDRLRGVSSYRGWGYFSEAARGLLSGDATASRLAAAIGSTGLGLAVLVGLFILVKTQQSNSGYGSGLPTVMGLILISFAVQMLLFSLLSRQIEALRLGGFRRKVIFRRLSNNNAS